MVLVLPLVTGAGRGKFNNGEERVWWQNEASTARKEMARIIEEKKSLNFFLGERDLVDSNGTLLISK